MTVHTDQRVSLLPIEVMDSPYIIHALEKEKPELVPSIKETDASFLAMAAAGMGYREMEQHLMFGKGKADAALSKVRQLIGATNTPQAIYMGITHGRVVMNEEYLAQLSVDERLLTPSTMNLVALGALGLNSERIKEILGYTRAAVVDTRKSNVYDSLGVASMPGAIVSFFANGLWQPRQRDA